MSVLADESSVHNFEVRTEHGGERHVVPVAWYGAKRPLRLLAGDEVVVTGMVRRRWFRAGGGSQSRTEVVAAGVAKLNSKGAGRLIAAALAEVATAEPS
jgi:single-strand DNA-binding protein